ncbi:hypothetical protein Lal_00014448 [Lupinus albus]|nr:hypothetical protein Lal_00014448 [Lupinus albus]
MTNIVLCGGMRKDPKVGSGVGGTREVGQEPNPALTEVNRRMKYARSGALGALDFGFTIYNLCPYIASFGSSNVANFGSSNVANFGSCNVASFGSSNVANFGSSNVARFGSSNVANFGSSYVAWFSKGRNWVLTPVVVSTVVSRCPVMVNGRTFTMHLICLPLSQLDLILGWTGCRQIAWCLIVLIRPLSLRRDPKVGGGVGGTCEVTKNQTQHSPSDFGSSNVASFGLSDVANFGSSDVASFGSSDVASFGSSDVASFGQAIRHSRAATAVSVANTSGGGGSTAGHHRATPDSVLSDGAAATATPSSSRRVPSYGNSNPKPEIDFNLTLNPKLIFFPRPLNQF